MFFTFQSPFHLPLYRLGGKGFWKGDTLANRIRDPFDSRCMKNNVEGNPVREIEEQGFILQTGRRVNN